MKENEVGIYPTTIYGGRFFRSEEGPSLVKVSYASSPIAISETTRHRNLCTLSVSNDYPILEAVGPEIFNYT